MTDKMKAPGCGGNAARAQEFLADPASPSNIAQDRSNHQSVKLRFPSIGVRAFNGQDAALLWRLAEAGRDGLLLEGQDAEAALLLWLNGVPLWLGPRDRNKFMQAGIWHDVQVEKGEKPLA